MKLVFTADTHFCSKFANENSSLRNAQLIDSFSKIAAYAQQIGAAAVLLGGDLFDTPYPNAQIKSAVSAVFERFGDLNFYAVCGNHDPLGETDFYSNPPKNLYVFPDRISCVEIGDIRLYGVSLSSAFDIADPWRNFSADGRFITLSHGTLSGTGGASLSPATLASTGAALSLMGHIHKTYQQVLPNGTCALYAGSPFGRGFDECGQKGFYVIDTADFSYTYINTDAKIYSEYNVDISNADSVGCVLRELSEINVPENEIARAVLTGALAAPFEIDCKILCEHVPGFVEIKDKTSADIDLLAGRNDNTLEGEFVRILLSRLEQGIADEKTVTDALKEGIIALRSEK